MRRRLVLLAATAVLAGGTACSGASASGLRGIVLTQRSPVCIEGRTCLEPIAGITLVFHHGGRAVARTTSRVDGAYRVRLPGGRYRVTVARSTRIRAVPARVLVVRGVVRRLDFEIGRGLQ